MATLQRRTEQSRALALRYVEVGTSRQINLLANIFDPTAMWTMAVDKALTDFAGSRLAPEVFFEATANLAGFDGYSFKAENIVAEGNHAFIDVAGYGKGPGPVNYRQNYAQVLAVFLMGCYREALIDGRFSFILTTSGDKITDVKLWSYPFQVKAWMESSQKYQKQRVTSKTRAGA